MGMGDEKMATDFPVSLKSGATPQDRALIYQVLVANGAPTLPTQGISVGMTSRVDVVLSETAGGTFDAKVWWWYDPAEVWVQDFAIGTISVAANSTAGTVTTPSAASRLYIEADNFAGGAEATAWAIGRGTIGRF